MCNISLQAGSWSNTATTQSWKLGGVSSQDGHENRVAQCIVPMLANHPKLSCPLRKGSVEQPCNFLDPPFMECFGHERLM